MNNIFSKFLNNLKILGGPKYSGKTFKLLKAASLDLNSCVVCANAADAKRIQSIINENNWDIKVITFNQFINKEFKDMNVKSFYFNEVDKIFRGMIYPKKVKMISFNSDNIEFIDSNSNEE